MTKKRKEQKLKIEAAEGDQLQKTEDIAMWKSLLLSAIKAVFSVTALVLFVSSSSIVAAQMLCVERVNMLNRLTSEYGEELIEVKMMEEHGLLEVLKSSTKGTWTLLLTKPGGISCVLATGKGLDTDEENSDNVEYET